MESPSGAVLISAVGTLMVPANHSGETAENLATTLGTEFRYSSWIAEQIQKLRAE